MIFKYFVLLTVFANLISAEDFEEEKRYDGWKVIRTLPKTQTQLEYLIEMVNDITFLIPSKKIDFWTMPVKVNTTVDLMVSPDIIKIIQSKLLEQNIETQTIIDDVGSIIDHEHRDIQETSLMYRTKSWLRNDTVFFETYHSLNEIYQFLDDLVTFDSSRSSVEIIGHSYENQPLKIIKIGKTKYVNDTKIEKPILWIDAGIHAREWIAPMTALYIANKFVRSQEAEDIQIIEQFDIYIMPSANPDGYEYSRLYDRLWRKTRSFNPSFWGIFCRGVDPNRNWGYKWKVAGSSNHPCSEIYHGRVPFSEPETKAMSTYIWKLKDRVKLYVSMHSYSQLILTPWGWTTEHPNDYPDMIKRANEGAEALKSKFGTVYRFGTSTNVLYAAAGGSDDWAYGTAGIKYSYTFELRDTGANGFVLPRQQILPTGIETFEAIKKMALEIGKEMPKSVVIN